MRRTLCYRVALLLAVFVACIGVARAQTSAADSVLTSAPPAGTVFGTPSNRQVTIRANTAPSTPKGSGGDIWAVDLFSGSCTTSVATPACTVSCSPASSPSCLSSTAPSHEVSQAHYVPATVTDLGTGDYTVAYEPRHPGTYSMDIKLLTQGGLMGSYYHNVWFLNSPELTRVDSTINFQWGTGAITTFGVDYIGVRWVGKLKASVSEVFTIFAYADDGVRVWVDRQKIIDRWSLCCNETWGTVTLNANHYHDIIVEYQELKGSATMELRWSSASTFKQIIPSTALYYGTSISGSPTSAVIAPGEPPSNTTTTASGTGLTVATAASNTSFTITARDIYNNVQTSVTASTFSIALDPTPAIAPISAVTYLGNGTYHVGYTPYTSGSFKLQVLLDAVQIKGSPFSLAVAAGAANASLSTAIGSGLSTATAGTAATFLVQVKDQMGNNVTTATTTNVTATLTLGVTSVVGTVTAYTVGGYGGLFQVAYTAASSGTYSLGVTVGGLPLDASPFTVTVAPGALLAATSTATGTGLSTGTAGSASTFTIQARDKFSNALTTGGATFTVALSGAATITATPTDTGTGTYTVSYTPTVSGTYSLSIQSGGVAIVGSPFAVTVSTGAFVAINSGVISGTGHMVATSGVTASFVVQSRDGNSNALQTDSATFVVALTCGSVSGTSVYSQNGQYTITYTPTTSGACSLAVTESGNAISGSPFSVTVSQGAAAAATTTVFGNTATGIAGVENNFVIHTRDASSNALAGGSSVVVTASGMGSGGADLTGTLTDFNNGTLFTAFTPVTAGTHSITAILTVVGGLTASFYSDNALSTLSATQTHSQVNFDTGFASPLGGAFPSDYFSIAWRGKIKASHTETFTFFTPISESCGVRLYIGGNTIINAWDSSSGSSEPFGSIALTAGVAYDIVLEFRDLTGAASVKLQWLSASVPKALVPSSALYVHANISGSPFTTVVSPAATSAATTTIHSTTPASPSTVLGSLSSSVSSTLAAGSLASFTVQARDAFANLQTLTGEQLSFTSVLTHIDTSGTVAGVISDIGSGQYRVDVTPTTAGVSSLAVAFSGTAIVGSPFSLTVIPGAVSAASCVATGTGVSTATVGTAATFTIHARDSNNNAMTSGGLSFSVSITGAATIVPIITDSANGNYAVSYTPVVKGSYTITIQLGGTTINGGSTYSLTVSAGSADASQTAFSSFSSTSFVVQAKDASGNTLTTGGERFFVRISNNNGVLTRYLPVDNNDGTYTVSYTLASGSYQTHVQLAKAGGLTGSYYNNRWLSGTPALTRVDASVDFNWGTNLVTSTASDYASIRWTGFILPATATTYTFHVDADEASRLYIDDILVIDAWSSAAGSYSGTHTFATADILYSIVLEYKETTGAAHINLKWDDGLGGGSVLVPGSALYSSATAISATPATLVVP